MDLKDKLIESHPAFEERERALDSLKNIRKEALKTFDHKGFPTKKEEVWKYTSLRPVLKEDYSLFPNIQNSLTREDIAEYFVDNVETYTLVFVDGQYAANLSKTTDEIIDVCPLSSALKEDKYRPVIDKNFNNITPTEDSLSSLNTAFSHEGAFIYIKDGAAGDLPIQVLHFTTGSEKALMTQPRNLLIVGENAQVQLIERHQSLGENPVLTNAVTEVALAKHAIVDYYKIQNDRPTSSLIDSTFVEQEDDSDFTIHTFSFGGKLTRNNVTATQNGEHINSTFKGITILKDKQHVDHVTRINHKQPNCESHQDYKGVFDDKSHGVFDGYIQVDKIAQKTDGYQKSDNLLLSDKATAHAKPQLEIYADDVLCSHGCTIGEMDEEALFYLKSRGIPEKEARALMMYAFSGAVLDSIKIPEIKKLVNEQIASKLGVSLDF